MIVPGNLGSVDLPGNELATETYELLLDGSSSSLSILNTPCRARRTKAGIRIIKRDVQGPKKRILDGRGSQLFRSMG